MGAVKKTTLESVKHFGSYALLTSVLFVGGSDKFVAYAKDIVTDHVTERVDELEQTQVNIRHEIKGQSAVLESQSEALKEQNQELKEIRSRFDDIHMILIQMNSRMGPSTQ